MDYEQMSIDELDAEIQRLGNARTALHEQAKAATTVRDRKAAAASGRAKLAKLTDAERAALKAELAP